MCLGKQSCTNINTDSGMQSSFMVLVICERNIRTYLKVSCVVDVICFIKNKCNVLLK